MRKWIITKLGGYPDIDSLLEVVDKHEDKVKILNRAVKHLFNTIDADDILREQGTDWLFEGKVLPEGIRMQLTSEAQIFLKSRLWKVLQDEIKYHMNLKMYRDAKEEIDLTSGKIGLYILDIIKTKMTQIEDASRRIK